MLPDARKCLPQQYLQIRVSGFDSPCSNVARSLAGFLDGVSGGATECRAMPRNPSTRVGCSPRHARRSNSFVPFGVSACRISESRSGKANTKPDTGVDASRCTRLHKRVISPNLSDVLLRRYVIVLARQRLDSDKPATQQRFSLHRPPTTIGGGCTARQSPVPHAGAYPTLAMMSAAFARSSSA